MVIKISGLDKVQTKPEVSSRVSANNYLVQSNQGNKDSLQFDGFITGNLKLKENVNDNKFRGSLGASLID